MEKYIEAGSLYATKFGRPTAVALGLFSAVYVLAARAAKKRTDERTSEVIGLKVVASLHALFVAPFAGLALFYEEGTALSTQAALRLSDNSEAMKSLIFGRSAAAEFIVPITVAFFLFEVALYSKWKDGGALMLIHHFGSIAMFPVALAKQVGQWHLLLFVFYEASSPFLHLRWFLSRFGSDWKQAFRVNNVLFGLSFLGIRNATAPALLASIYRARKFMDADPFVPALMLAGFIPVILNTLWGVKVLKAVAGTRKPRKKPKDE